MPFTTTTPRIFYTPHGERGSWVLLIMGFGMSGDQWGPQVERLVPNHRVLTFDNRGIGRSEPTEARFRMSTMADDALRVLDAAGAERAHVVGVSMGGMIAQELALRAGDRLRSLTLIATQPGGVLGWLPTRRAVGYALRGLLRGGIEARKQARARILFPQPFLDAVDPAKLAERLDSTPRPSESPATVRRQFLAVARHDVRDRIKALRCPTLVIKPSQDYLVRPHHSDWLAAAIPDATLRTLPDVGHGLLYHAPDDVHALLSEHLAAHDEQVPGDVANATNVTRGSARPTA